MTARQKQIFRHAVISVSVFAVGVVFYLSGILTFLENKTYDSRIKVSAGFTRPSEDICVVGIDQYSIDNALKDFDWGWPWPRSAYAEIVDFMNEGGANSVTFDVFFTEPSVYRQNDDETFAQASKKYGRVIQTMFVSEDNRPLFPIRQLRDTSILLGNNTSAKDSDDVIRRARISYTHDGIEYPALGLAPVLADEESDETLESLRQKLPLRKDGTVLLRYKGPVSRYFPYSAYDVIKSWRLYKQGEKSVLVPEDFSGADVVFMFYAPGLFDICSTPISQVYPGAGVHITMLDNLLTDGFIREIPRWLTVLFCLAMTVASSFSVYISEHFSSKGKNLKIIGLFVLALFITVGLPYAMILKNIYVPLVAPLFCLAVSFTVTIFANYAAEGRQKRFIKSAFSQYLSPFVIERLIQNPEKLKLGGEKRNISIFFSDIQGFTSISEKLDPIQLTEVLNRYLTEMSDIILESGGTIDKYEGDAIIALWNAPTDIQKHSLCAVRAALECQKMLENLGGEFTKMVGCPLLTRIGLNTGEAVVGNMGSRHRFDYTMFGDAVNLAARLEGLNKQFGTYLMCSSSLKENAEKYDAEILWRELGKVQVVGKSKAVQIFEPFLKEDFLKKKDVLLTFADALSLFYSGNFKSAKEKFSSIEDVDAPAKKYAARCQFLMENPPQNWEGVWVADTK